MKARNQSSSQGIVRDRRGQIVVEYVLLLVVGVGVAVLITSTMVSRDPAGPGFLVRKWVDLIRLIGSDRADDVTPKDGG